MSTAAGPAGDVAAGVSLDALFRSSAAARPAALALIDPADREEFTHGSPRRLTYQQADAAIDRLARQLRSLGLGTGSVVALQLPAISEGVIALLAILRARMVAVPVPMAWRRSDLVAALGPIEPKALITLARFGEERPAEIACEVAVELFSLSFPCAFGSEVPDGVIALDDPSDVAEVPLPSATTAEQVAIATIDATAKGYSAAARGHAQWLAIGLAVLLEAKIETGDTILSTLPASSLAGIGAALVPWLLSGGTLRFFSGSSALSARELAAPERTHLIAPAVALPRLLHAGTPMLASAVAVHRSHLDPRLDLASIASRQVVDLFTFGEIGAVARRRSDPRVAKEVPLGPVPAPTPLAGGPTVIETRVDKSELLLRGPMVPIRPFPSASRKATYPVGPENFIRTGYRVRAAPAGGLVIEAGPSGVLTVGGLRFGLDDLTGRIATSAPGVKVEVVEDPLLGQRLRVEATDPAATAAALNETGHARFVAEAVVPVEERRRAAG